MLIISCPVFSMQDADMPMAGMGAEKTSAAHLGKGTIRKIDAERVMLAHGPIATLNWPVMTMSFKLKNPALAKGLKTGDAVDFELVQQGSAYVVTRLTKKQ